MHLNFKFVLAFLLFCSAQTSLMSKPVHGLEIYGNPKYKSDFSHFDYVNPKAPKGGQITMTGYGTFDSLNPFVIKGTPAAGMQPLHSSYFYATLMEHSHDEPLSAYCYIAETVELAEDKKSITFTIRPEAKFHDNSPIMAADVVFTFNILKDKGNPYYRSYYRKVKNVEELAPRTVRFNFTVDDDKELPLIIGEIPILSKAYYTKHDFTKASMDIPMGSGPYKIGSVDAGKSINYSRIKDWWGAKLPVNVGRYNFDEIKIIYFLDSTVALEAFKSGDIKFRLENVAKNWANSYDTPAFKQGLYTKLVIPNKMPQGMSGLTYNIRREVFQDLKVRKALALVFDFEWANKNLFYSSYKRSNSYYGNSELASKGLPSEQELKLLEPFRAQLPAEVFTQEFKMPENLAPTDIRKRIKEAKQLLLEAGYEIKEGLQINKKTGKPLEFEILIAQAELARIINGYIQNLKTLGVTAKIRVVDSAQYQERADDFDYDMIWISFPQSINPGNEQESYFSSKSADLKGGQNYIGIKNPAIDTLTEHVVKASNRQELLTCVHALDRVLLWNYYMIPGYHLGAYWIAKWSNYHMPEKIPEFNLDLDTMWYQEATK